MKYWWLEKYQQLEVKMLPQLWKDIQYHVVVPKNYLSIYEKSRAVLVKQLKEEELLIELYVIIRTKNIKDNRLLTIIQRLLQYPESCLPISDYTLKEILVEVRGLEANIPLVEKMDHNNVAACYHCLQIFYVDHIHSINRNQYCLCPFCGSHSLYFDNDYIPMNYSFLKLASLYYDTSVLGCKFSNIQKMLKKNVTIQMGTIISSNTMIQIGNKKDSSKAISLNWKNNFLQKITSREEPIFIKDIFDALNQVEQKMEYQTTFLIHEVEIHYPEQFSFLVLIAIMETLSKTIYLRNIVIVCEDYLLYQAFSQVKKVIESFKR